MEIAYANPFIHRTQTAPIMHSGGGGRFSGATSKTNSHNSASPLVQSQGHTSSNYSIQSQPSSRSSDTTQGTTHSTLFPPPPLPSNASAVATNGGAGGMQNPDQVMPTENIMNSVADASSSLFQICVTSKQRLMAVPSFSEYLMEEEEDADEDTDPVTLLWRTFRRGEPLLQLYNVLRPDKPLTVADGMREDKRGKAATFKFIQACVSELKFPQEECFIITDLYGDDTTGFVKVARVVNRVLDILVQRRLIEDIRPTANDFEQAAQSVKRTQRQHIISELVTTERTYVQHLELLQAFKHLVEEKGVIPGDAIHDIFLNLNALLDFQRRFLIRVEQTNHLSEDEQNWGKLFVLYNDAFRVYEPYIANQKKCEKTVVAEFPKLQAGTTGAPLEMRQMVESPPALYGFLMKPFQRLTKYPMLLDDLYKKGDLDDARKQDLLVGKEAATSVLASTNKAVDREEKAEAVQELKNRVEDWKSHRVEGFGELLLYGTFTVLKSENLGSGKDGERQYHVYLFETILLCCKDIDLSKPKNKLSSKQLVDKRGKPKLQLKGRIFMQNVTDLISLSKPGNDDSFHMSIRTSERIFWKGDPSIENFIIRFTTDDMMRKWAQQIESQRRKYRTSGTGPVRGGRYSGESTSSGYPAGPHRSLTAGTSATEFEFMRNQTGLENPYAAEDDEDEYAMAANGDMDAPGALNYGPGGVYPYKSEFATDSRNVSSTSLRSRSTTGDSMQQPPPNVRQQPGPPGRFPQQNLSLRTRDVGPGTSPSPADMAAAESYFSPIDGSPSQLDSSRTSASSGMYSFPIPGRQSQMQVHVGGQNYGDETPSGLQMANNHSRFTAPAMARQRETSGSGPSGRPQMPRMHSAMQQVPVGPIRNRSASSPDIHNQQLQMQQQQGLRHQPPVPDVPPSVLQSYQQQQQIARSQSNSPSLGMNTMPPPPGQRVSPQMHRDRQGSRQLQQGMDPSPTRYNNVQQRGPMSQQYGPAGSRSITPVPGPGAFPGPTSQPGEYNSQRNSAQAEPTSAGGTPTQLKVKVHCPLASQTLTLVVPLNISAQSLKDRIDAKLQRSTQLSLSDRGGRDGQVKLKFLDDDDDYVSIQSDEDVQTAFESWKEQLLPTGGGNGPVGEVELFCTR